MAGAFKVSGPAFVQLADGDLIRLDEIRSVITRKGDPYARLFYRGIPGNAESYRDLNEADYLTVKDAIQKTLGIV